MRDSREIPDPILRFSTVSLAVSGHLKRSREGGKLEVTHIQGSRLALFGEADFLSLEILGLVHIPTLTSIFLSLLVYFCLTRVPTHNISITSCFVHASSSSSV